MSFGGGPTIPNEAGKAVANLPGNAGIIMFVYEVASGNCSGWFST